MQMTKSNTWLSLVETARKFQLSERKVRQHVDKGQIETKHDIRDGRVVLVNQEAFKAYLEKIGAYT